MGIDSLKVLFTYGVATLMILGGLIFLLVTRLDPPNTSQDIALAIVGFIGISLNFVYMRETATNSARQTERAVAIQAPQPTVTVSGNPPTTTVTPAEVPGAS